MKHFTYPLNFLAALVVTSAATMASADGILTVSNGDTVVEMDAAALGALPQVSFETTTIWTEGTLAFSGPSLRSVLDEVGLTEGTISLTAVNDYAIQISVDEIEDNAPIVATLVDGQPLSRREKGPYWLVFPFDSDAKYQSEAIYSQSIWQLVSIKPMAAN